LAADVLKGDEAHRLGRGQRLDTVGDALARADDIAALALLTVRWPAARGSRCSVEPRGIPLVERIADE
jgi:hypothetical protein